MDETQRCQSCGMPLSDEFYGTNKDNTKNKEYCKFCYKDGSFTNPGMTLNEMLQLSVEHMVNGQHMGHQEAEELARATIPQLKRWKGTTD